MRKQEPVTAFSSDHPERRDGEVWITNTPVKRADRYIRKFRTARLGDVAYGRSGDTVPGMVPVFVSPAESVFWYERLHEPDEHPPVPYDGDPFAHGGYMERTRAWHCGGAWRRRS